MNTTIENPPIKSTATKPPFFISAMQLSVNIWYLWSLLVGAISLYGVFFRGPEWVLTQIVPWSSGVAGAFALLLPLILLLICFRGSRPIAAVGLYFCSSMILTALWVVFLAALKSLWGTVGTIVGLLLLGWGVIPTSIVAQAFDGNVANALLFAAIAVVLVAMKYGAVMMISHRAESLQSVAEQQTPDQV